jgi:pimeloyl-ACP methyl ester carboxylesterase
MSSVLAPADIIAALDRASTRHTTASAAGEVVWRTWGAGAPLILLHGGTGSWMHWVRNIEALSQQFMLVVPDLPGSGESGGLAQPITAEHMAQSLLAGLSTLLPPDASFSIAGFSLGGLIAGYLAQLAADRADVLVLVGGAGNGHVRPGESHQPWASAKDSLRLQEPAVGRERLRRRRGGEHAQERRQGSHGRQV